MWDTLNKFYKDKKWVLFRVDIVTSREPICWHCKKPFLADDVIIVHHKEELTIENVNDYNISLNPDNVEMVHHLCHNQIHSKRFGYEHYKKKLSNRAIYIVAGPPFAGKTSYVLENKQDDDVVIDMDRIFEAITLLPRYNKPNQLLPQALAVRDKLIDTIKVRYGKFNNAFIIGGYADKYQRESLIKELGAKLILINPGQEEVIKRLNECQDERLIKREEWERYINEWYEKFIP